MDDTKAQAINAHTSEMRARFQAAVTAGFSLTEAMQIVLHWQGTLMQNEMMERLQRKDGGKPWEDL